MSADAELRSLVDRILRLKEEQDALAADIRDIYAEGKGKGYNKTALGQVVAHLRKVEKKGADAVGEADTIFDMYLNAYRGTTGTVVATRAHTHEKSPSPVPRPQGGDGGRPGTPSTDARPGGEQGGCEPDIVTGQSVHQSAGFMQARNEPGSVEPASATRVKTIADYRPHCLSPSPSMCAASGLRHCHACSKAAGLAPSEAA